MGTILLNIYIQEGMRKKSIGAGLLYLTGVFIACTEEVKIGEADPVEIAVTDTVTRVAGPRREKGSPLSLARKRIYLTIDDSPLNGSLYIDSVIAAEQVKANIFLVGKAIEESRKFGEHFKKLQQNPYIRIYNHSYSHASHRYNEYYRNPVKVVEDFERNQLQYHILHKIARLPGRNLWRLGGRERNCDQAAGQAAKLLADEGYHIFGWDLEWRYTAQDYAPEQTIDQLVEQAEKLYTSSHTFTPEHVVLLVHDQMFAKKNEQNDLGELIRKLKEKDFTFEYLTAYPFSMEEGEE